MTKKKEQHKPLIFIEILCIALIIFVVAAIFKLEHRFNQHQFTQTYTGIFPCADCAGINTSLTLTLSKPQANQGTYTLEQSYQGKNVQHYNTSGTWTVIYKQSQQLLVLDPNKPMITSYYLMVNPATIQMLDKEKQPIHSPIPPTLYLRR